jgi:hypothetical protein
LPATFHPLEHEDLQPKNGTAALARLNPAFGWWQDNDYVATSETNQPISLNLGDVLLNNLNGGHYETRNHSYMKAAFWDELISRYLKHSGVENFLLKQLDIGRLAPETISINSDIKYNPQNMLADFA